jgi:signal peptidase
VDKYDGEKLQVGDIVTYHTVINGEKAINTHRIVEVIDEKGMLQYRTQGDNKETNPEADKDPIAPGDVIGKYNGTRVPVLGSVIDYLSTQLGFFLVILLPVLLFTLYQIYKLVMVILHNHKVDVLNSMNESTSDEVKEAIIAEYLAKQKEQEAEDKND